MNNFHFFWAGWKANAEDLQRFGWQMKREQYYRPEATGMETMIVITHPKLDVVCRSVKPFYFDDTHVHLTPDGRYLNPYGQLFPMEMIMVNRIILQTFQHNRPFEFQDIKHSMEKEVELRSGNMVLAHELFYPTNPNEIIIQSQDVSSIMDIILRKQAPKQQEIRERLKRESMRGEGKSNIQEVARIIRLGA